MFPDEFRQFIAQHALCGKSDKVLLAVSGGADSVVMSDLFFRAEIPFGIAHCNFHLRGTESDKDAEFVKGLASRYEVPFFQEDFDLPELRKHMKMSVEEAARELRYKYFEEIRRAFGYTKIATAHQVNDSMETVLMHLARGTGIAGLTGIPIVNGYIIRPMLFATREEIEAYAGESALQYCTDSSNTSDAYDRNKIRNTVVPALKRINPSLEHTFARNIRYFRDAENVYRQAVTRKLRRMIQIRNNAYYLNASALRNTTESEILLFEFLHPFGFGDDQILNMLQCLKARDSGKIFPCGTHRVIIDRNYLVLTDAEDKTSPEILIQLTQKTVHCPDFTLRYSIGKYKKSMHINPAAHTATLDAGMLAFPLLLRLWRPGDYMYPLGIRKPGSGKPGKKKVSDILSDLKLPLNEKEKTWVLLSGEMIVWLVGIRIDMRFAVSGKTQSVAKFRLYPPGKISYY